MTALAKKYRNIFRDKILVLSRFSVNMDIYFKIKEKGNFIEFRDCKKRFLFISLKNADIRYKDMKKAYFEIFKVILKVSSSKIFEYISYA